MSATASVAEAWSDAAVDDVISRYRMGDSMERIERDTGFGAERVKVKLV